MTEIEALEVALSRLTGPDDANAYRVLEDRLTRLRETAARLARPYTHKVVGHRHHQPSEEETQSLDEAISLAFWMINDETMWPERIETIEGEVVLEGKAFSDAIASYKPQM